MHDPSPTRTDRSPRRRSLALLVVVGAVALVGCGADERTAEQGPEAPSTEEREAEAREVSGGFCAAVDDAQDRLDEIDPTGAVRALRPWRSELPEDVAEDLQAHLLDLELATNVPEPAGDDEVSEAAGQRFAAFVADRCDTTYAWGGVQAFE